MKRFTLHTCGLGMALALVASPVDAQQQNRNRDGDRQSQRDRDRGAQDRDRDENRRDRDRDQDRSDYRDQDRRQSQRDRSQRGRRQDDGRQGDRRRAVLVPSGWITIGTDMDQDGRFESRETIYYYDLVEARRSSERRRGSQGQQGQRDRADREQQTVQLQGTIQETRTARLRSEQGEGTPHLFAKVDTRDRGIERVCLGRKDQLSNLDLRQGDRVSIKAERHRVNNRPILVAKEVEANGRTVDVQPMKAGKSNRVRGTIESTERKTFRGHEGQFVVAEVELQSGRTATINLGPESRLNRLDLQEGDEVRVMAREGRIDGESALIAEEVHANDQSVNIPKSRRAGRQNSGSDDRTASSRDR